MTYFEPAPKTYSDRLEESLAEKNKEMETLESLAKSAKKENKELANRLTKSTKTLAELTSLFEEKKKEDVEAKEPTLDNLLRDYAALEEKAKDVLSLGGLSFNKEKDLNKKLAEIKQRQNSIRNVQRKQELEELSSKKLEYTGEPAKAELTISSHEGSTSDKYVFAEPKGSFKIGYTGK